jgi:hypothetical protein
MQHLIAGVIWLWAVLYTVELFLTPIALSCIRVDWRWFIGRW